MRSKRSVVLAGAALLWAAATGAVGCSKDKGTNPNSGTTLDVFLTMNGGSGSFAFNTEGVFPYKCKLHPVMAGDTVIVSRNSTVDRDTVTVVGVSAPGFSPRTVTVNVGGTVRWENPTGSDHQVVND